MTLREAYQVARDRARFHGKGHTAEAWRALAVRHRRKVAAPWAHGEAMRDARKAQDTGESGASDLLGAVLAIADRHIDICEESETGRGRVVARRIRLAVEGSGWPDE